MTTIQVCRICLSHDTRMYIMADMPLQTFYEQMTNKPFNIGDGRLSAVCYICYHLLKKCRRFSESAIKADELLQQIYSSGIQITEHYVSMTHKPYQFMALTMTPVTRLNVAKDVSKNESDVKSEKNQDPLDVERIEYEQEGMADNASDVPKQSSPTDFGIKKESMLDMCGTEEDGLCTDTLPSQDLHHSSDIDDDGNDIPLESVKLEENDKAPEKVISEKAGHVNEETVDAEFREIILTKEEQIEHMLEKTKSPNYLRMRHKCELCCKGFPNLRAFGLHKKKHGEGSGAFECDVCHTRWRSAAQLTAHENWCHSTKRYACNHCKHQSKTVAQARKHYKSEHGASKDPAFDRQAPSGAPVPKKRRLDQSTKAPERSKVRWYFRSSTLEDAMAAENPTENETYTEGGPRLKKPRLQQTMKTPEILEGQTLSKEDVIVADYLTKNETKTNGTIKEVKAKLSDKENKQHSGKNLQSKNKIRIPLKKPLNSKKTLMKQNRYNATGKQPFKCNYCGKMFTYKTRFISHVGRHTGEKPFSCNYCEKKFFANSDFIIHVRKHTGEKLFTCNKCGKMFANEKCMKQHLKLHTNEKPFICDYCGNKFKTRGSIIIHIRIHTGEEPYSCNYCGKKTRYKGNLDNHLKIHTGEKPFTCDYCGKMFRTKGKLVEHIRLHTSERPFSCDYCIKTFALKIRLTRHLRAHSGVKPFTCDYCEKKFAEKYLLAKHISGHMGVKQVMCDLCGVKLSATTSLKSHIMTHTREKPFACSRCGKKFASKSHMKRHDKLHERPFACNYCEKRFTLKNRMISHVGKHTGEKPFICNCCGHKFLKNSELIMHLRKHTGEKPFTCNSCGKKFTLKKSLKLHLKAYASEKRFMCNYCGCKFRLKGNLMNHIRIHTGEKPFTCVYCGKRFTEKSSLSKHLTVHSGENLACNYCDFMTDQKYKFKNHVRLHTCKEVFKCDYCDKIYTRKVTLIEHIRIHTGEKPFTCNLCGKKFMKKAMLLTHMKMCVKRE